MIELRRERRLRVIIGAIVCMLVLYWWMLQYIQPIEPPKPDPVADNREQIDDASGPDSELPIGDSGTVSTDSEIDMEALARRRESLEQEKQKYRNQQDRLLRRLDVLLPSLDESRSAEKEMLEAWNSLQNDEQANMRFSEMMAKDYVATRESRSTLPDTAAGLADRHLLLKKLAECISGEIVGMPMTGLSLQVDELESSVDEHARMCREITRQVQRLTERAQDASRGDSLHAAISRLEIQEVSPELERLTDARELEIADECDSFIDDMVAQAGRKAEKLSKERQAENAEVARSVLQKAEDALAAHESEQQRVDGEIEAKRMAVEFKQDRANLESVLVPFIALKRTYMFPSIVDGELNELHWANIPLEQAASLSEIESTGAFESGADSFERLERFTRSRMEMLGDRYLPFGQHWSYHDEDYLILARELLEKHGQAMVEAGMLRP